MMTPEERQYVKTLEDIITKQNHVIAELRKIIDEQAARIADLERRLNMNSNNSSKPPSSDGFKKKTVAFESLPARSKEGSRDTRGQRLAFPALPARKYSANQKSVRLAVAPPRARERPSRAVSL